MKVKYKKLNFAIIVFIVGALISAFYFATYLFTVTDEAFVVVNMTPISSAVGGHIDKIFIENGQQLKKGDPILQISPEKYHLEYDGIKAQYDQAKVGLLVIKKRIEVTQSNLKSAQDQLNRMKYEHRQKNDPSVRDGVLQLDIKMLEYNIKSQENLVISLQKQIELEKTELEQANVGIETLRVATAKANLDVKETIVRAPTDGYIQNLFIGIGTSALPHQGLFNYIDTGNTYIQANFNETDLVGVNAGDKVLIYPRAYLGKKVFHGVVMSSNWSIDRQHILPGKETQFILSANHWINLPQRLPVQIKITDTNAKYPLRPGMSAYVYIKTK
ncbi:MAG: efflux RND transporter periplasmic adaptor subunit [Burkholderiales bacterium]|nr:efflux RND transporter periplasmic adaptor subunit [Burkholderiales bacterium]